MVYVGKILSAKHLSDVGKLFFGDFKSPYHSTSSSLHLVFFFLAILYYLFFSLMIAAVQ